MYNNKILSNGIDIVMENIPYVNSISLGIWIKNGSINEDKHNNGISHFIEHLLFKGTKNRTAKEIAESIDNIGGQLNAFTTKEYTCFYAKVLNTYERLAIDLLSDMLKNSLFNEEDILKEKKVIYEEIKMYQDSPEDIAYDLLAKTMFEGTSLELPILGTIDSLESIDREDIIDYFKKNYIPENIVVSIVGNINENETLKLLEAYFGDFNIQDNKNDRIILDQNYVYTKKINGFIKDTEQLNLLIGMEGLSRKNNYVYPLLVFDNIFGGSMSSRLFQRIREDKGLAYSVYSHPSFYEKTGTFTIYVGLNPEKIYEVVELVKEDIEIAKKELITKEELFKSKEQLKGNYLLGLENTSSRMAEIGRSKLLMDKTYHPNEIVKKINEVDMEDIEIVVEKIFNFDKLNTIYVGNLSKEEQVEKKLKEILYS
ncbi:insulinase family protein [Anaerosalibacter bizertensis]|uniref:Insulinase family protein n=1 Tax=Anaerosalibacter bizertensis TaxID=932217 RepID=A0A9Q4ABR6_9FIRM|nr:pitrilysin family protein [Anaerosalibacter bizertensis]MBV1818573.1 insulinase family protein [Bacteroidales bacterium MSK.15.36]MCG4564603.1 insulinase family protein [Anaerosalibacter bizertensis]MCG4582259.1 insulinase family protein [Anaerosalibacter bizertensis]